MTQATQTILPADYWENLVAGTVRVKRPSDVQKIARMCADAYAAGKPIGAWHASAQFYSYLHRCNCQPCTIARAAA